MNEKTVTWMSASVAQCRAALDSVDDQLPAVEKAAELLVETFRRGNKLLTAGNGGSAAESMHMSEEAVGRYHDDRISLPAVALTADGTALTCIGNDYGFDRVFSRQVEGLGKEGDLLVLFSTSGNGRNLDLAVEEARRKKLKIILLLGRDGGKLAGRGDVEIIIRSDETAHIQEAHQVIMHMLLEAVDRAFKGEVRP